MEIESSKLLIDFLEIFYPSKAERHTLLHGVLTNFKNSMGSEGASARMDLVYQVNQSFIGAKHEMLFSLFPSEENNTPIKKKILLIF